MYGLLVTPPLRAAPSSTHIFSIVLFWRDSSRRRNVCRMLDDAPPKEPRALCDKTDLFCFSHRLLLGVGPHFLLQLSERVYIRGCRIIYFFSFQYQSFFKNPPVLLVETNPTSAGNFVWMSVLWSSEKLCTEYKVESWYLRAKLWVVECKVQVKILLLQLNKLFGSETQGSPRDATHTWWSIRIWCIDVDWTGYIRR